MTDSVSDREGTGQVALPVDVPSDSALIVVPVDEPNERPTWDVPTAIVGLVLLAAATAVSATAGAYLGWAGAGCGTAAGCNGALIVAGIFLGTLGVIITAIVFLVITIARITVRRIAWWMPFVGIGAVALGFLFGALMAGAGSAG